MNSSLHFFTVPALMPGDARHKLNLFLQQQRVVALEQQWVADGAASYWSLCVTVLNGPGPRYRHWLKPQGPRGAGRQPPNAPRAAAFDTAIHRHCNRHG